MSTDSYLRGANHFIRLDGAGWVLIDGPLKDMLDVATRSRVTIPVNLHPLSDVFPWPEWEPVYSKITFERVKWHPGVYRYPTVFYPDFSRRYDDWQRGRCRRGWRVVPDGGLPVLEPLE